MKFEAGGEERVGGVLPSPTGPFPYKDDQIAARDKIIRVLWTTSNEPVNGLDQDHVDLLKEIIGAGV